MVVMAATTTVRARLPAGALMPTVAATAEAMTELCLARVMVIRMSLKAASGCVPGVLGEYPLGKVGFHDSFILS